jgi:hypothetical protein
MDDSSKGSVRIDFANLQDKTRNGKPYQHLHGLLKFEIDSRRVPHMGYWSENDVCFNQWIGILVSIQKAVQEKQPAYLFDECEQGQPAFLFEVTPPSQIFLSIVESECGEGFQDPDWQKVAFAYADFKRAFLHFKERFLQHIAEIAPHQVDYWTAQFS